MSERTTDDYPQSGNGVGGNQDQVDSVLAQISRPRDLQRLTSAELVALAQEIRQYLINSVAKAGGHLGPNLGVVELSIALHRVFNSPSDTIVWDTGHQAYVHKLLTGRKDFSTLRQPGGISGYPSRAESIHDVVENSHASTALSWADGISIQKAAAGESGTTVAVIGDGALTGGMAWEALNNIADGPDVPLVIVVNDNGRSYAPTVGGLAHHLDALRTSSGYEEALSQGKKTLQKLGAPGQKMYEALHGLKTGLKDIFVSQRMFSDLGFKYIGPVDGHDLVALELAFARAKAYGRPVIVHTITQKGRGYTPAERDIADRFHAVGQIHPETGLPVAPQRFGWTAVFAEEIVKAARADRNLVGITAAMQAPVGLQPLAEKYPDRVIDVGIAEQHAFTLAAGMAFGGAHPVVCVYATFMNRAFDQLLMDVGLHQAPVTVVLDRAGITGDDGASHNGVWDLSLAAMVPGLKVFAPRDAAALRKGLSEALRWAEGPTIVRYPKGEPPADMQAVKVIDGMDVIFERTRDDVLPEADLPSVLLVGVGALASNARLAGQRLAQSGFPVTVVDPGWVLPINPSLVELASAFDVVLSVEDGVKVGGVGSELSRLVSEAGGPAVEVLGVPREFLPLSSRALLLEEYGLDEEGIFLAARARISRFLRNTSEGSAPHKLPRT